MKVRNGDMVLVKWFDPSTLTGWKPRESLETMELEVNHTLGYLVGRSHGLVKLAATLGVEDDIMQGFALPKGCVKSITRLVEG